MSYTDPGDEQPERMTVKHPSTGTRVCPDCGEHKSLQAARCQRCAGIIRRTSEHGTESRHQTCSCQACKTAATRARRERMNRTYVTTHGVWYAYTNYGCRCDACRAAYTARRREHRAERLAATEARIAAKKAAGLL